MRASGTITTRLKNSSRSAPPAAAAAAEELLHVCNEASTTARLLPGSRCLPTTYLCNLMVHDVLPKIMLSSAGTLHHRLRFCVKSIYHNSPGTWLSAPRYDAPWPGIQLMNVANRIPNWKMWSGTLRALVPDTVTTTGAHAQTSGRSACMTHQTCMHMWQMHPAPSANALPGEAMLVTAVYAAHHDRSLCAACHEYRHDGESNNAQPHGRQVQALLLHYCSIDNDSKAMQAQELHTVHQCGGRTWQPDCLWGKQEGLVCLCDTILYVGGVHVLCVLVKTM